LARVSTGASDTTFEFGPVSIAAAFGGTLPPRWTLVCENQSDSTLSAAPADHDVHYIGAYYQVD